MGSQEGTRHSQEEHAARLVEQPESVLSVLLSPDLAPHILAQLPTAAHAAKGTCRAWRRGWKETLPKRERPCMLAIGGHTNGGEFVNSLERYDPSTNEWEEEAVAPMPTARRVVGTAVLDGKLYTAGGESVADGAPSNLVERYDPATNAWEAVTPLADARYAHGMAVLDGKLYAVGGQDAEQEQDATFALKSIERYDPALDAWEAVAPMAEARESHAVAVLEGKLYAVGGFCDDGYLSSVERYDPATNAWEAVAPMAEARYDHAVAVLDGKLYAVGGCDDDSGSSVERYDPALDAWEAVAPMAAARESHAVAALDGKLYVAGGLGLSSVERYDPAVGAWEAVALMAAVRNQAFAVLM